MAPRFSVILPFLNEERYLAAAIESVQAQQFSSWELLLVDDGSTDASRQIAADKAREDPRITLLQHAGGGNRGVAASRNLALGRARGEFVTFLDGDDLYLPDRLSSHDAILAKRPGLVALYGAAQWLYEGGEVEDEDLGPLVDRVVDPPGLIDRVILNHEGAVPCVCSITLKRDAVTAVGGFDESFTLYEDQTLWVKIFARYPVFISSHCGAVYRQHGASTSARAVEEGLYSPDRPHEAGRRFLNWLSGYLRAEKIASRPLRCSLDARLALYDPRAWVRWPAGRWLQIDSLRRRLRGALIRRTPRFLDREAASPTRGRS